MDRGEDMAYIVFENLFALFAIIASGFVLRKLEWVDDNSITSLSKILMGFALPITIFLSMQQPFSMTLLKEGIITMGLSALMIVIMLLIGRILAIIFKAPPSQSGVIAFGTAFPNSVYIGMPVIRAVLGEEAMFYVSMYVLMHNILAPTLGVYFMQQPLPKKEAVKTKDNSLIPVVVSIVAGLTLFFFSIEIPTLIGKPLQMISNIMTPISMIIVGNNLAKEPLLDMIKDKRLFIIAIVKLVGAPLVLFGIMSIFIDNPMIVSVLVFLASMPTATLTTVFSENIGADEVFASQLVVVATLLSMITIPLMAQILL